MKDSTKKFWKSVLIFAAGATLGALVAYEIARHKYELSEDEQYFADLADELKEDEESTEEIKRTYNKDNYPKKEGKVIVITKDKYKKTIENLGYDANKDDRIDPAELESPPEDDSEEEDEYDGQFMSYESNGGDTHIITMEEFAEEMGHYDKISLTFYEDDEVLTDESEEIIDDPIAILGEDALVSFGVGSGDPEVVYVRNDWLQIDYEVIRLSKSYKETVLGDIEGREEND
jgi:hypothetical protein